VQHDNNNDDGQRLYTRREWLTRHALLSGATPGMAREAVSSTAMSHEGWDMDDERRTLADWDVTESGNDE
jgi:hypothetical protein